MKSPGVCILKQPGVSSPWPHTPFCSPSLSSPALYGFWDFSPRQCHNPFPNCHQSPVPFSALHVWQPGRESKPYSTDGETEAQNGEQQSLPTVLIPWRSPQLPLRSPALQRQSRFWGQAGQFRSAAALTGPLCPGLCVQRLYQVLG